MKKMLNLFIIPLLLVIIFVSLYIINIRNNERPNSEVVEVNSNIIKSRNWDKCSLDINSIERLDNERGYYWAIYNNPDQFDSILCLSMNKSTYKRLQYLLSVKHTMKPNIYNLVLRSSNLQIYYSNCEECLLVFN